MVFREDIQKENHILRVDRATSPVFPDQHHVNQYPSIDFEKTENELYANIYDPGEYRVYMANGKSVNIRTENLPGNYLFDTDWTVRFDPEWGKKEPVLFNKLISWTEFSDPQIRYFSGKATYENKFTIKKEQIKNKKSMLDLGNVEELAVITINNHTFPVSWYPPFEVDITPYIREGENTICVDVVNMWPNRLIGDGKLPALERKTKTNIKKFDATDAEKYIRVAGLLGPVQIKFFDRIKLTK